MIDVYCKLLLKQRIEQHFIIPQREICILKLYTEKKKKEKEENSKENVGKAWLNPLEIMNAFGV